MPRRTGASGASDDEVGALNYLDPGGGLPRGAPHQVRQRVHAAAADRRPQGRPGLARAHAGRADDDLRRVLVGRRRRSAVPRWPALRRRQDRAHSCRARRSTTRSATSGTTASSGTATTRAPRSAAWTRPAWLRSPSGVSSAAGILLDIARFRGKENLDKAETFTHEDLMACAEAQGVKIEKRDILVIRTDFLKLFFDQRREVLRRLLRAGPGLQPRAGAVVPRHGDPEPRHRHHRQRGDRPTRTTASRCRCTAR